MLTVSESETRWESNAARASARIWEGTVKASLVRRDERKSETWEPARLRRVETVEEEFEEEVMEVESKARYQSRRSKLLLTRMSMAGLKVSITPEECAALNVERGVEPGAAEESGTGCFSYDPDFQKRSRMSLELVAMTSLDTGSPIRAPNHPARTSPKFPGPGLSNHGISEAYKGLRTHLWEL